MAFTTPKIGLRVWNQEQDIYDHAQLADNFVRLDYHDHTPGRGVAIPTEGIADGAITPAKLSAGLDTSGLFTTYQFLNRVGATTTGSSLAAGTYLISPNLGFEALPANVYTHAFYLDPADFAAAGRTISYRLRAAAFTNALAPGTNFTYALNLITAWGSAAANATPTISTLGTAVGSTTIGTPALNTRTLATPVEFVAPVAGWYTFSITTNAATTATSVSSHIVELFMRRT